MATLTDELKMVVDDSTSRGIRPDVIRIQLKEKLQLYVLDFIYNSPKYNHLIFYGGTCLRKCFGTGRMSEDIDFETSGDFEKKGFAEDVAQHFKERVSYPDLFVHTPGQKVSRVELRFPVLNSLGLSKLGEGQDRCHRQGKGLLRPSMVYAKTGHAQHGTACGCAGTPYTSAGLRHPGRKSKKNQGCGFTTGPGAPF